MFENEHNVLLVNQHNFWATGASSGLAILLCYHWGGWESLLHGGIPAADIFVPFCMVVIGLRLK
jgi:hypothetical protein